MSCATGVSIQCSQQAQRVAAMPPVSMVRGLTLTTRRTPPKPQEAPTPRLVLVQQSPTKAATQSGKDEGAAAPGLKHCGEQDSRKAEVALSTPTAAITAIPSVMLMLTAAVSAWAAVARKVI